MRLVSAFCQMYELAPRPQPPGEGGQGMCPWSDVHLTTIRTLDIKLATLLQTLASAPGWPKAGSMDFGERLTVG